MTKKLLLSAAALGVMAFAGAANSADVTGATISDVALTKPATGAITPYYIAKETDFVAANLVTKVAAVDDTFVTIGMDSNVAISEGGTLPFAVTFTLTGPATFDAGFAYTNLKAGSLVPSSGVAVVSADKKSVSFFVEFIGGTGGSTISLLTLENMKLKLASKEAVSIAAEASVTVAGHTQTVTVVQPTKIIDFKTALVASQNETYNAVAKLTDFKNFVVDGTTPDAGSASADVVTSNPIALTVAANVRKDLQTTAPLDVAAILDGATATLTGPQVKSLGAKLAGHAPVADTQTATQAVFALDDGDLVAADEAGALVLTNPATKVVIEQGTYTVKLEPKFASGFSGNANQDLAMIKVDLQGTNFVAPWFALDNAGANSTLRLANNGSAAVGPVIISLKANNGSAAPTGTHTIASIPAGGFVSVTGATLKAAFGTNAANGDLQVTIQSDVANVSAKVRTTQSTGQIFENSLGTVAK